MESVYQLAITTRKLATPTFTARGVFERRGKLLVRVGWDRGNGGAKLASTSEDGTLETQETPNYHKTAENITSGERHTTYRLYHQDAWSLPYWIGEDAAHGGQPLPTGSTALRLSDVRQLEFDIAVITGFLRRLHLTPGDYTIIPNFAIPNDEIVFRTDDESAKFTSDSLHGSQENENNEDGQTIRATKQALDMHFTNKTYILEETDKQGSKHLWTIRFKQYGTQPQTMGSFLMFTRTVTGKEVDHKFVELDFYDLGFGDLQATKFILQPRYSMRSQRIGDGMQRVVSSFATQMRNANVSKGAVNLNTMNDAEARMIVHTKQMTKRGQSLDVSKQVKDITAREGAQMASELFAKIRRTNAFCAFVGGPTKDSNISSLITQQMDHLWGDDAQSVYMIFDPAVASEANAIGAYLSILWATSASKK